MIAFALLAVAVAAAPTSPPSTEAPNGRVLTLEEALETARTHQPALRQASADTAAARARANEARAPLLPQLNGAVGVAPTTQNLVAQPGTVPNSAASATATSANLTTAFTASLTLTQLIWDFGQTWDRFQAARASASATEQDERTRTQITMLGVRTAFFAARAAKELAVVAKETLANQERHFGQVQGFVEVGTRPAIDLAQARTDRANARVQLISAQNGYASARAQLNQAMGVEGPADFDVADDQLAALPEEALSLDKLVDQALSDRPEYAAVQERVRAQQEYLSAARGGYGPALALSSRFNEGGTQLDALRWNWNVGLQLQWNLFGGLLTSAQVDEAEATVSSALAQVDLQRQQIRLEVEQAFLAVNAAAESAVAADEALSAARDRLRLAEGRYQTGVGNIIELGDAQLALTNAAAQKVQATFNLSTARAQLLKTLGRA